MRFEYQNIGIYIPLLTFSGSLVGGSSIVIGYNTTSWEVHSKLCSQSEYQRMREVVNPSDEPHSMMNSYQHALTSSVVLDDGDPRRY